MTKLTLENIVDRGNAANGLSRPDEVRRVEVEALVDTGATTLVVLAGVTPLIGQVQLEMLDLVVDLRSQEARPNPRSPDAPMYDTLGVA
jgi:hypothetical protein